MIKKKLSGVLVFVMIVSTFLHINFDSFATSMEGNGTESSPYLIQSINDLYNVVNNPTAHYKLMNNLNFGNQQRAPISEFSGVLDGNGKSISNMNITGEKSTGLFSVVENGVIKNLKILSSKVTGTGSYGEAGILIGQSINSKILNCSIMDSEVKSVDKWAGGLVGQDSSSSFYQCSVSTKLVSGRAYAGGIIGISDYTVLSQCASISDSIIATYVGGIVGTNNSGAHDSIIIDCYARSASVYGTSTAAGIIGLNNVGPIINSYFAGKLSGSVKNALDKSDTSTNSYFDKSIIGYSSTEIQGRTTSQMYQKTNYVGWDFDTIWTINNGSGYPKLRFESAVVNTIPVESLTFAKTSEDVRYGNSIQLTPIVGSNNATNKKVAYYSDSTDWATVDVNGLVKTIKSGISYITAKTVDGSNLSARFVVYITDPDIKVTRIEMTADKDNIMTGEMLTVNTRIYPGTAGNKTVQWSSDNESVATVDSNGVVEGKSGGTATITAKALDGSNISNSYTIIVENSEIPVTDIDVLPMELKVGEIKKIIASVVPEHASNKELRYASRHPHIASIDADGNVTGISEGIATIAIVSVDGIIIRFCDITVTIPEPAEDPLNLALNATVQSNSVSSSAYKAEKAVDGDMETRWLSKSNVTNVYLELTFPNETSFNNIKINEFGNRIDEFSIQIWNGDWIDIYTGNQIGTDYNIDFERVTTDKVRILVKNTLTSYGPSIYEFEVYNR